LDGAHGDAERVGDLSGGHPEVVGHHEDDALLDAQASEGMLQLVAVGEVGLGVASTRPIERQHVDLDGSTAHPPSLVVAGVHEDAPQPRLEAVGITQSWELAPSADETLLDGVVGAVDIAKDAVGERVEAIERGRGERQGLSQRRR
jgi:hypothetical protein